MSSILLAHRSDWRPQPIICVETSDKIRELLSRFVNGPGRAQEFRLTHTPEDPIEILTAIRNLTPALIVVEESSFEKLPVEDLKRLIQAGELHILVFSDRTDDIAYQYFFRRGVSGVLPTDVTGDTLRKAIYAIFEGVLWLPREIVTRLALEPSPGDTSLKLTRRESEILELICRGFTNQQIADHCFISRETVRWHVRGLYGKLGVENRVNAIKQAKSFVHRTGPDPIRPGPE